MRHLSGRLLAAAALPAALLSTASPALAQADVFEQPAQAAAPSVATAQKALSRLGYYQGPQDGKTSPALTLAITAYQRDQGLNSDGQLDSDLMMRLAAYAR